LPCPDKRGLAGKMRQLQAKKEIDALKRIVFLIVASLLVIGLVLPGCGEAIPKPVRYVFEGGKINIGVAGELNQTAGAMQWTGAMLAQGAINRNGGVDIGGVSYILDLVPIETGEETVDPTGLTGVVNLTATINNVDFILGGLQTEAVEVYRDVAMEKGVIFIDCGAATEALQHSVVDDYASYRFWFKGMPCNEYFLGQSVVRMLGAVAMKLREGMGVAANYTLNATIIADNLAWAYEQVVDIKELLRGINVNLVHDPYWVDATGSTVEMQNVLTSIAGLDPQFIIPIFSADAGVLYDKLRASYVPNAMSVGMNVMAQLKSPWGAGNLTTAPPGGPACAYEVILDTWAEGLNQTSQTAAFLTSFMNSTSGEYPLNTAATYDALFTLKAAIEAVAKYDAVNGTAYAMADDIIKWLEDPANAQVSTTGNITYYPRPGTTAAGKPALTEAQVRSLYDLDSYDYTYTYGARDWTMPPHTTHDLVYGPGRLTDIGAQWQWDATAGQWKKVGVWPMYFGDEYNATLTDQYGCWNFAYNGTQALVIPQNVINHHKPK
jgi:ABC-type branched-subunit amino acid transport system substrate-binding protein